MAVKVRQRGTDWYTFADYKNLRRAKKVGPGKNSQKLAEQLAAEWRAKLVLGKVDEVFPPKAATPTAPSTYPLLKDALPEFIDKREKLGHLRGASTETYRALVRTWIIPALGHLTVDVITRQQIGALIERIKLAGRSASVVQRAAHILKGYYADLVERELLAVNPAERLQHFKGKLSKGKLGEIFSKEECRVLLAATEGTREWGFVNVALGTGARWGEIAALTRDDVDLVQARVHISKSWSPKAGKALPTKSGKSRFVPLSPELVEVLRGWIETRSAEGWGKDALMFSYKTGGHLMHWQAPWKRLLKRAGLRALPFHSLRHAFASHAIKAGARLENVQRWMGHSSLSLTIDTYRSFIPDAAGDAEDVRRLGSLLC